MTESWPMTPLGDVLTERRETPDPSSLDSGQIPIVAKVGFNDGKIQLRTGGNTKTGMILIRPGDVVVSGINAAKGAIALYGEEKKQLIAATIHYGAYIPDKSRVDVSYLWWLLRSATFRALLQEYVPGGIKIELKAKRFLPIPVPLPPITEQRRIVTRIDELATKIGEAKALRRVALAELDAIIKSALTNLSKMLPLLGVLGDVLAGAPRNGWSSTCDNIAGGTAILSLGAITGFRYKKTEFKRTSAATSVGSHYWLNPGDLLMTRSNTPELVGHAAIYDGYPTPCIYPDLMMRLIVDGSRANKRFVHFWLQSSTVREFIYQRAKGTSPTMKKISQGIVSGIPFPTSLPLPEQAHMVAYLDSLQAKVDVLKALQAETAAELDALLPSVLDRAFTGSL